MRGPLPGWAPGAASARRGEPPGGAPPVGAPPVAGDRQAVAILEPDTLEGYARTRAAAGWETLLGAPPAVATLLVWT